MQIRCKINDEKWVIKVVNDAGMIEEREDGAGLAGLCIPAKKLILVHEESVDLPTILHELFHGYVSELFLDDTNNLPISEVEEIFAGMFAAKAELIIKKAKEILKKLNKKGNQ